MNNLEPIIIFEPLGRRRPDLYSDITVSVLKVPAGKGREPGGLPNFLKEEEKKEYKEEKDKDDEEKEEDEEGKKETKKEWNRRDEEDM